MARTFYRIVKHNPPTLQDFMSFQELGRQPRHPTDPEVLRRWDKVSVWGSEQQARRLAKRFPRLGAYIAKLDLPDDSMISVEASGPTGHYSVTATAAELLLFVTSVVPVEPAR